MSHPCSDLVTDYIKNGRGEPGLFSFEYDLLPKLLLNFYQYMDQALNGTLFLIKKRTYL